MQQEIAKVRLPKEFPRLGVAKYLQKLTVSCTFFMNTKNFTKLYKFGFQKKCHSKAFASATFCHLNIISEGAL